MREILNFTCTSKSGKRQGILLFYLQGLIGTCIVYNNSNVVSKNILKKNENRLVLNKKLGNLFYPDR